VLLRFILESLAICEPFRFPIRVNAPPALESGRSGVRLKIGALVSRRRWFYKRYLVIWTHHAATQPGHNAEFEASTASREQASEMRI
jgi:hypothetical protein